MFNRQPSQNNNSLFNPSMFNNDLPFQNISNFSNQNEKGSLSSIENNSPFMVVKTNSVRMNLTAQNQQNGNNINPNFSSPNYKNYTPSPNLKEKLSDRFIPCRGTNLIDRFEMTKILSNKDDFDTVNEENQEFPNNSNGNNTNNITQGEGSAQSNKNYTNLLKKNFFGNENDIFSEENSTNYLSSNNANTTFQSKLFKYKTEDKKKDFSNFSNLSQQNSLPFSALLNNYKNVSTEPERKFSKIPFKILDAPGLMDDFYLNLVDWSNDNDLVVGLHNSVFIWSANKSRVQKLTEYGDENYVSSVAWNQK
jgi:hypothetical protein